MRRLWQGIAEVGGLWLGIVERRQGRLVRRLGEGRLRTDHMCGLLHLAKVRDRLLNRALGSLRGEIGLRLEQRLGLNVLGLPWLKLPLSSCLIERTHRDGFLSLAYVV